MTLAEKYIADINEGLAWNVAHPQVLSDYFCVEITFKKTLKGKELFERKTLGVVHKDDEWLFRNCWNADIMTARWPSHIENIRLHTWPVWMNHKVCGIIVTNEYILEKYGLTAVDVCLKKLRTL